MYFWKFIYDIYEFLYMIYSFKWVVVDLLNYGFFFFCLKLNFKRINDLNNNLEKMSFYFF